MRPLSDATRELLNRLLRLYETTKHWRIIFRKQRQALPILEQIGASGEPGAIFPLLPFLMDTRDRVDESAANTIHKLMPEVSPIDFIQLDDQVRHSTWYSSSWEKVSQKQVRKFTRFGEAARSVLGLASCHTNGYVREAAIRELTNVSDGSELPFLLVRLNDWVRNVREAARAALRDRLTSDCAVHLIKNMGLIRRLSACGRENHSAFVELVNDLLKQPDCHDQLIDGTSSRDKIVRRTCYQLLAESPVTDSQEVIGRAFSEDDPVVRLWAVRLADSALEGDSLLRALSNAKLDKFMPVRRETLSVYVSKCPDAAAVELRAALLDRHPAVRSCARFYMAKKENVDFAAFYRESLSSTDTRTLFAAISGLGETGSPDDAKTIFPYSSHAVTRIRRASIHALSKLNGDVHVPLFLGALKDESPSVAHEARTAMMNRLHLVDIGIVRKLYSSDSRQHVRLDALQLLSRLGKWKSLPFLITACADHDPKLVDQGQAYTLKWLARANRDYTAPTREDLTHIEKVLQESRQFMKKLLWDELHSLMEWWLQHDRDAVGR